MVKGISDHGPSQPTNPIVMQVSGLKQRPCRAILPLATHAHLSPGGVDKPLSVVGSPKTVAMG